MEKLNSKTYVLAIHQDLKRPILQEFDLKIPVGKRVGLVGGSGSGKSSVIALLERFYDPSKGYNPGWMQNK